MSLKKSASFKFLLPLSFLALTGLACGLYDSLIQNVATVTPAAPEPTATEPAEPPVPEATPTPSFEIRPAEFEELAIPAAENYFPIYLADNRLLVFTDEGIQSAHASFKFIFYFESWVPDAQFTQVLLPNDIACPNDTNYLLNGRLPDGRIGMIKRCHQSDDMPAFPFAIDWDTRAMDQFPAVPLPFAQTIGYSWNPDMGKGIAAVSDLVSGMLHWFEPAGSTPLLVTLNDGQSDWSFEAAFADPFNPAAGYGMAGTPAWSPDGSQVAFSASLAAMQLTGLDRLDAARVIYLLDPATEAPTPVLDDVYYVSRLSWSADSQWLLFNGRVGQDGPDGLWLFNPFDGRLWLVYEGDSIYWFDWSPDMKQIALARCTQAGQCDEALQHMRVILLDMEGMLE